MNCARQLLVGRSPASSSRENGAVYVAAQALTMTVTTAAGASTGVCDVVGRTEEEDDAVGAATGELYVIEDEVAIEVVTDVAEVVGFGM